MGKNERQAYLKAIRTRYRPEKRSRSGFLMNSAPCADITENMGTDKLTLQDQANLALAFQATALLHSSNALTLRSR